MAKKEAKDLLPKGEVKELGQEGKEVVLTFPDHIRTLRLAIDATMNTIDSPMCLMSSAELRKAHNSLTMAKSWMGKILGLVNEVNPYPESHNSQSPIIEKAAESTNETRFQIYVDAKIDTQTTRVKDLRLVISEIITNFRYIVSNEPTFNSKLKKFDDSLPIFVLQHLEEAKMWLGWELNRIRKEVEWKEIIAKGEPMSNCEAPEIPLQ